MISFKYILFATLLIGTFSNSSVALAQETITLRAITTSSTLLRTRLEPSGTALVTPSLTVTAPPLRITSPSLTVTAPPLFVSSGSVNCTKTVNNGCTIFTCNDGTSINTCDLQCKNTSPQDPPVPGSVATDEPKINAIQPKQGNAGTIVRVYFTKGKKNFSGFDAIEVGGVPVKLKTLTNIPGSSADFYLEFALPENAVTGKIALKKPGLFNTAFSEGNFVVIPWQDAPVITSIEPIAGYPGQEVTVELFMGKKTFSGIDSIQVGGINAKIILQSDIPSKKPNARSVKFIVPLGAKTGKISLKKPSRFATVYSQETFTVVPAQNSPTILSFSPTGGKSGDQVTIKLVNGKKTFSGLDGVFIGDTKAEVLSFFTDTSGIRLVTIKIPPAATTDKIILRKPGLFIDAYSKTDLLITK